MFFFLCTLDDLRCLIVVVIESGAPPVELDRCFLLCLLADLFEETLELVLTELATDLATSGHVDEQVLHHGCLLWLGDPYCVHWKQGYLR